MKKRNNLKNLIAVGFLLAVPVHNSYALTWDECRAQFYGGDKKLMQGFAVLSNGGMVCTFAATGVAALGYSVTHLVSLGKENIWPALRGKDPKPSSGFLKLGKALTAIVVAGISFYGVDFTLHNSIEASRRLIGKAK